MVRRTSGAGFASTAEATRGALAPALARDPLTVGALGIWLVGTVVAALGGGAAQLRELASVVAVAGLTLWMSAVLRDSLRRRRAGFVGHRSSRAAIALFSAAAVAGVALAVAVALLWVGASS